MAELRQVFKMARGGIPANLFDAHIYLNSALTRPGKEIHMRVLMAVAAVLSASLAMVLPAEANQQKQARSADHRSTSRAPKSEYHYSKAARDNDCRRAESLDPAGNFNAYPCWARNALAPKTTGN
jgi:hypothetical protein